MHKSLLLLGVVAIVGGGAAVGARLMRMGLQQGYSPTQPIAFSHKLHAGDNHVPCLYCHFAARSSRHAGIPSSSVCMNCHGLLEKQTAELELVREAAQFDRPILRWTKVHNLPDFVYFNHSRHVLSGVECQRCHGPVETMQRIEQAKPLNMGWCLDCHREHAGIPSTSVARVAQRLANNTPAPATGLDCASCHY
jgi:hypothetical protein